MKLLRGLVHVGRGGEWASLQSSLDDAKVLAARTLLGQIRSRGRLDDIHEAEFKVFSQFGDDGLIQYLIGQVPIERDLFVEFGVEDYTESNTRFLLVNNNWKGLVMDADPDNIRAIRASPLYWRHDLTAAQAFVTRESVNQLLASHGFAGPIGLLSIDVDGNDYWIWEALSAVDPDVVVIEYNSLFGPLRAVAVPYDPHFRRAQAHHSHLYWGASLKALWLLARKKGYSLVGCNSNGNNAYFVKDGRRGSLAVLGPEEAYMSSRFRESRDEQGRLSHVGGRDRLGLIEHLTVQDLEQGRPVRLSELAGEAAER
jgi:hypothetical protein